ncbi:MAG TPA: ATP-binding protein [Prolixibacteraceae bacterium]|nr:ATP-binding protein [Prolixibacteraceae bacterium]
MRLNVSPIHKFIAQGEHQQQDFKFCISDSRKIARTLVAFANTDGGRLLVGVKDNGKVKGVQSEEEIYMVEAAAALYSKPKIKFTSQEWDVDGKLVLEIWVDKSPQRPHFAENDERKWVAYIRRNDENIIANPVLLKKWKLEKRKSGLRFSYDEPRQKLLEYLSEHESISLSKFLKIARITSTQAENILAELLFIECLSGHFEQDPVYYTLNKNFDMNSLRKPVL